MRFEAIELPPLSPGEFLEEMGLSGDEQSTMHGMPRHLAHLTEEEHAGLARAAEITTFYLIKTARELIRERKFTDFDFTPEDIEAILRSADEELPFVVGRLDGGKHKRHGIIFYEFNLVTMGGMADAGLFYPALLQRLRHGLDMRSTLIPDIRDAFHEIVKRRSAGDKPFFWQSECPPGYHDIEYDFIYSLFRAAAEGTGARMTDDYVKERIRYALTNPVQGLHDFTVTAFTSLIGEEGRLGEYKHLKEYYQQNRWQVLPPAWTMLLDRKAIWVHAYERYGKECPHFLPATFDEARMKVGGDIQKITGDKVYVVKPNDSWGGQGVKVRDATANLWLVDLTDTSIFQAYAPPDVAMGRPAGFRARLLLRPFMVSGLGGDNNHARMSALTINAIPTRANTIQTGTTILHSVGTAPP